eukprot:5040416-Prymnesium_polylepis.1
MPWFDSQRGYLERPAFATHRSTRPKSATALFSVAGRVTSALAVAMPCILSSSIASSLRAVARTAQPRCANSSATARPMPVEQPVTRTRGELSP